MPIGRINVFAFLPLCILIGAQCTLADQVVEATGAVAFEDAPQTEATTTKANAGLILVNLLILSLYGFPLSIVEVWALVDPAKAEEQPKTESPELLEAVETSGKPTPTIGDEAPTSIDDWAALLERLPHWVRKPQGVPARLVAGGCLTVVVVVAGAVAFAFNLPILQDLDPAPLHCRVGNRWCLGGFLPEPARLTGAVAVGS